MTNIKVFTDRTNVFNEKVNLFMNSQHKRVHRRQGKRVDTVTDNSVPSLINVFTR